MAGATISQDGITPNNEKTEAIKILKAPTETKTLKSFLGEKQYKNFIPNLSEKTDNETITEEKIVRSRRKNMDFINLKNNLPQNHV